MESEGNGGTVVIDAHLHIFPSLTGFPHNRGISSLPYGRCLVGGKMIQAVPPSWDPNTSPPEFVLDGGMILQILPPSFADTSSPPEMALRYMDMYGVDKAVLAQAPGYGLHDEYVARAVTQWPDRFIGITMYNPLLGSRVVEAIERWLNVPGMVGVKLEVPGTRGVCPDFHLLGDNEMMAWETLSNLCGLLMIHLDPGAGQCDDLLRLVETFPGLRVCILHLGQPPFDGWRDQVRLARHERIYVDTSALPWVYRGREEYPYPAAQQDLQWAVGEVGAHKIMWGSDYPSMLVDCTYGQLKNMIRLHSGFLTPDERALILGGTAARLLAQLRRS